MYHCCNCGKDHIETHKVGLQWLYEYEDGTPVPDIMLFACDECWEAKRKEVTGT